MNTTFTKPKRLKNKNSFLLPPPRMLRRASFILILFLLSSAFSCKEDPPIIPPPPPPDLRKITLTFEDASCTEVWIKIKADSITLPAEINLLKDATTQNIILTTRDTLLYIDSLTPNQTYSYQAVLSIDTTIKSETVTAQTLEPTSHNFTWQTFEFGQHSSSVLYDVVIIDENNIWAVGAIHMNDSLGNPDPNVYNAVHWDGQNWELRRIMFYTFCPQATGEGSYPAQSIFVFDDENIVISSGSQIAYLSNGVQIKKECVPVSVNKIWGTSLNDFYIVGYGGNIAHYNGSQWTKIESGTTLHLIDIYGDDAGNVYAAGVNIPESKGVLLKGNSQIHFSPMITGEIINPNELFQKLYGELSSVWIDDNNTIYTGGNLFYNYKNNKWDYVCSLPENFIGGNPGTYYRGFIYSIRGNASNDYIIAGDRNTLKHFNGITWEQIGLPYTPSSSIIWFSVNAKTNTVVAVGTEDGKAKVIMLSR